MKGKIKLVVGLMFATTVAAQAALIYVENFDNLDPTTDTVGTGALGGQGQLEDIAGSTWSGVDTDSGDLQTRVLGTGDRNLNIRTHQNAAMPQINNAATFTAQNQASAFGFYYNLDKWGTDGSGAGNNFWGKVEIGVRDSVSGNNVLGIQMFGNSKNNSNNLRAWLFDYTSGTRTDIGRTPTNVDGNTVRSIGFAYDGAGNIVLTVYAGVDQTGTALRTISGTVSGNFSADSLYIKASQAVASKNRTFYAEVDDITVITPIPEPATLGLIAVMAGGLLFVRRRIMM